MLLAQSPMFHRVRCLICESEEHEGTGMLYNMHKGVGCVEIIECAKCLLHRQETVSGRNL